MIVSVNIKILEGGKAPIYKTEGSCGADCFSRGDIFIPVHETRLVPLGFALELPEGYECQVRGRSGNSRDGIQVQLGTVDCDYRGEISAIVYNATDKELHIPVGYRIAQIVIQEVPTVLFVPVDELKETARGTKGFGSTGSN